MNGNSKPAGGRSRPTNNQLLYKAHFRWEHYTSPLTPGVDLPEGTEACASVTSAFLQVLATIHRVESCRADRPRNILQILSTNTRRTKVVELSTGTHRVADELRRHSLADGEGGHYSTNLDRNRYGSDNNYLFTVTKFNLDCLGLCPLLVDIEIVDTRNGNESQLVAAGAGACTCSSPARKERADASHFAGSVGGGVNGGGGGGNGGGARLAHSPAEMRRVASTGHLSGGMKRVPSAPAMRRPPSSGRLADYAAGGGGGHRERAEHGEEARGTRSRTSGGGSELFDALLLAATEDRGFTRDDPPVTSLHYPTAALARQRSRAWHSEVDSLQNAIEAFKAEPDEVGTGGLPRMRSRRMLRRNSVSMIIENPVLAQTGAAESLLLNHYPPFQALPPLRSPQQAAQQAPGAPAGARERGAGAGGAGEMGEASVRSHEGDTESKDKDEMEAEGDEHDAFREGLLRHYHKQSSAVNLSRMAHPAELRRLQEELRQLREESRVVEGELEEAKMREREARDHGAASAAELARAQALTRRAADAIQRLKQELYKAGQLQPAVPIGQAKAAAGGPDNGAERPLTNGSMAAAAAAAVGEGGSPAGQQQQQQQQQKQELQGTSEVGEGTAAEALEAELAALEAELADVRSSEQEIEALRAELAAAKKAQGKAEQRRRDVESKLAALTAACGGPAAAAAALRHAAAAAGAPAGYPAAAFMPPLAYGPAVAYQPHPIFGLPPLGPYAMHPAAAAAAAAAAAQPGASGAMRGSHQGSGSGLGAIQKVASMPLLGPGLVSPHHLPIAPLGAAELREWGSGGSREGRKRRGGGSSPIAEEDPEEAPQRKRRSDRPSSEEPPTPAEGRAAAPSTGAGARGGAAAAAGRLDGEGSPSPGNGGEQLQQQEEAEAEGGAAAARPHFTSGDGETDATAEPPNGATNGTLGPQQAPTAPAPDRQQQQRRGRKAALGAEGDGPTGSLVHPLGVATPKDAQLLPADPLTGTSVAPLSLPALTGPAGEAAGVPEGHAGVGI